MYKISTGDKKLDQEPEVAQWLRKCEEVLVKTKIKVKYMVPGMPDEIKEHTCSEHVAYYMRLLFCFGEVTYTFLDKE